MKRSLFKYFDKRQYAEEFLDGKLLFRSLAYFRDIEDAARGDHYEGTSIFRPDDGLQVYNRTQNTHFTLPMDFASSARANEIFVYCVSQTLSATIAKEFRAVACVQITNIATLCARIESALPPTATFKARRVDYYLQSRPGNPRWALPEYIATSKLCDWASQDEYRFVFSLTDALGFEKVELQLIDRKERPAPKPNEHSTYFVEAKSLRDICIMLEAGSPGWPDE